MMHEPKFDRTFSPGYPHPRELIVAAIISIAIWTLLISVAIVLLP
jgi:uncharacterized membrane protein YbhN (UPF0104 family)